MNERLARKAIFRMLNGLRGGSLELWCKDGAYRFGTERQGVDAVVTVHNERFFSRLLWGGEDAAGDAYVDGDWSSPDPVAVVRLAVRNLGLLRGSRWTSALSRFSHWVAHRFQRNTIVGSRRNIHAHYDLSNDFFRLFLDREMLYSSAIFRDAGDSLEQAQVEKIDRICRKLRLEPGDRLLEIGTGWGAFALHAARRYGCEVTTTTISREQYDAAQERFAAAGEAGARIELLFEDYRNLRGSFDKIASIEVFEAVGLEYYDAFFGSCDRLLAAGGAMVMQAITMNERWFDSYRRESDWIQRRIFPGAQLASVSEILQSVRRATHLDLFHLEDIGMHYAETLAEWRRRFHASRERVLALGFGERFCRMWDYYLIYCEGAFRERHIGDVQLMLVKNASATSLYGEPWRRDSAVDRRSLAARQEVAG